MVPYMTEAADEPQILDNTPELQGFDTAKIVFTDISVGASNRVRECFMSHEHEPNILSP